MVDPDTLPNSDDSYQSHLFSANEPQWQCEIPNYYGSLEAMPWHCQRSLLEKFDKGLDEYYGWQNTKENPMKISVRYAWRRTAYSFADSSEKMMHYTLSATVKRMNDEETDNDETTQSEGIIGRVEIENPGPDPIEFNNAENSVAEFSEESQNMKNFREAADATRKILQGNNECASLFGGMGEAALDSIISKVTEESFTDLGVGNDTIGIEMNFNNKFYPSNIPPVSLNPDETTGFGILPLNSVKINKRGAFISQIPRSNLTSDKLPRFGNYSPASLKSRVVQLLHEIGHLLFRSHYPSYPIVSPNGRKRTYEKATSFFPVDVGNPTLSDQNTDKVLKSCRKYIDELKEAV